jgi:hypothetical protein
MPGASRLNFDCGKIETAEARQSNNDVINRGPALTD